MSIPIPEYMKIRHYVVNQVANADGQTCKILSEREMCLRFGVARGTVRKALDDLIREKYLIARRGMGTFVNPQKTAAYHARATRTVGVALASSLFVNISPEHQRCLMGAFKIMSQRNIAVQLVNFIALDTRQMFKDIEALGCDGLLWIMPNPPAWGILERLFKRLDALVVISSFAKPAWKNVVLDDYQSAMLNGAERLMAHAGTGVVFVGRNDHHPAVRQLYAAFEALFAERGLKRPPEFTVSAGNIAKPLRRLLREKKPKALYSQGGEFGRETMEVLRQEAAHLPKGFRFLCQDAPEMQKLPASIHIHRICPGDNVRLGRVAAAALMDIMDRAERNDRRRRLIKVPRSLS